MIVSTIFLVGAWTLLELPHPRPDPVGDIQPSSRRKSSRHAYNPACQSPPLHWPISSTPISCVAGSKPIVISSEQPCRQTSVAIMTKNQRSACRRHWCLSNCRRPMRCHRATSRSKSVANRRSFKLHGTLHKPRLVPSGWPTSRSAGTGGSAEAPARRPPNAP